MRLCPDGSYVSGNRCKLCPDGTYIGGNRCKLKPDGSYGNSSSYSNNSSSYRPTTNSSFDQGYREGEAIGNALGILLNAFFGSK